MKKIITSLITAVLLALSIFALCVNGTENELTIDIISDNKTVLPGEKVSYKIAVNNIKVSEGIAGVYITVHYDTDFFDASSVEAEADPNTNWTVTPFDKQDGTIVFQAMSDYDNSGNIQYPVKNDGVIYFTVKMNVKDQPVENAGDEIYIDTDSQNTYVYKANAAIDFVESIGFGTANIKIKKILSTPADLKFENMVASCTAVENATGYSFQLMRNGSKVGKEIVSTESSYDFSSVINADLGGSYTFTVKALSSNDEYGDSEEASLGSDKAYKHKGKLTSPTIKLQSDKITSVVSYTITDKNPEDAVECYIIRVYEKGKNEYKEFRGITYLEGDIKDYTFEAGKEYEITVIAEPSDTSETGNEASDESKREVIKADGIIGIKITTKPKLEYTEGDVLDLSALKVTLQFAVSPDTKISFKNFSKYNITTSIANGKDILLSMDGTKITVSVGKYTADSGMTLKVEKGKCQHADVRDEHLNPTCGEDGYDREICTFCDEVVSETVIPATGEHTYTEWVWLIEPTPIYNGVRQRECSDCKNTFKEENIPYEEVTTPPTTNPAPDESTSNNGSSSIVETTTPDSTDNGSEKVESSFGKLGKIGKIFLIVLVVIFALIVLLIVIAIWAESRRTRRRRSNARTNQARKTSSQNRTSRQRQQNGKR